MRIPPVLGSRIAAFLARHGLPDVAAECLCHGWSGPGFGSCGFVCFGPAGFDGAAGGGVRPRSSTTRYRLPRRKQSSPLSRRGTSTSAPTSWLGERWAACAAAGIDADAGGQFTTQRSEDSNGGTDGVGHGAGRPVRERVPFRFADGLPARDCWLGATPRGRGQVCANAPVPAPAPGSRTGGSLVPVRSARPATAGRGGEPQDIAV